MREPWRSLLDATGRRRPPRAEAGSADPDLDLAADLRRRWGAGSFRHRWLCACAAYPVLGFDLTLRLGAELARQGTGPARPGGPPDEEEVLALARLPWFRQGWMPERVRLALLRDLGEGDRRLVRAVFEGLLFALFRPAPRGAPEGPVDLAETPPQLADDERAVVRGLLDTAPRAAPEGDAIFVGFMSGAALPADGREPERGPLATLAGAGAFPPLRRLAGNAAAAVACAAALWAVSNAVLLPYFEYRQERTVEGPELVELRGGAFLMGSPSDEPGHYEDEGPQHEVRVGDFAIGRREVTFADWDACVEDGGCGGHVPGDEGWGREGRPVINVSWEDAQAYVRWLSERTGAAYRLPSEAEWEYAARAGTTTRYWWGGEAGERWMNYGGNVGRTTETGAYPPNPWGLFDTSGNVWEWVQDCWHESYAGAPADGSPWEDASGCASGRVVRGGSWLDGPELARSALRVGSGPVDRNGFLGFRVSRTLTP